MLCKSIVPFLFTHPKSFRINFCSATVTSKWRHSSFSFTPHTEVYKNLGGKLFSTTSLAKVRFPKWRLKVLVRKTCRWKNWYEKRLYSLRESRNGSKEIQTPIQSEHKPKSLLTSTLSSMQYVCEKKVELRPHLFESELPHWEAIRSLVPLKHQFGGRSLKATFCRTYFPYVPSSWWIREALTYLSRADAILAHDASDQQVLFVSKERFFN